MCKQYTLCYECGHKSYRRDSSCNRHKVVHVTGHGTESACHGSSFLRIHIKGDCNVCQIAQAEGELEFNAEAMRIGMASLPPDPQPDAPQTPDEWKMKEMLDLCKRIPPQLKAKPPCRAPKAKTWQTRRKCRRTRSLLCTEVLPETVVGHFIWESVDASSQTSPPDNRQQTLWDATWDVQIPSPASDEIEQEVEIEVDDCEEFEDSEIHNEAVNMIEPLTASHFSQWHGKGEHTSPLSPIQLGG